MSTDTQSSIRQPKSLTLFAILSLIWLAMFVIALSGSPDFLDNEQRVAAYVLDVVHNGNWVVQHDVTGAVAPPPPHELLRAQLSEGRVARVVSNHPRLEWTGRMATIIGPLQLRLDNA